MGTEPAVVFFHAPQTRSSGTRVLLEELGAPYELRVLNMQAGEQRQAEYLKINPLGKVPTIKDGDAIITEQVAIFIYLADRFPQAGLAPPVHDPRRGPYLRWIAYYGSCYEPALIDRALKREPAPLKTSPYGEFDSMFQVLADQIATGPYLLGDTLTAADILWGVALDWSIRFGLLPPNAAISSYVARITKRKSFIDVNARDTQLAAQHAAAMTPG
ncbi:MAG: glutathione S-transferase family protein [Acidiferrobacter sp.]